MRYSRRLVECIAYVLLILALAVYAPVVFGQCDCDSTAVSLPGTEVRQLTSAATGRDYDIYIRFPESYNVEPERKYPVLYVLDGQWDFKLLDSIYGGLLYDEFVPEIFIVGITYSGPDADYGLLRQMDYTIADWSIEGSGDAPKFHTFIRDELVPFIETDYRAEPGQRFLMGSSYGGFFTLYVLFTEPELFSGYVAASPWVPVAGGAAFTMEAEYAATHDDLPVKLYLTVGELEPLLGPVLQFMQTIHERDYPGLVLEARVIEGERHAGNKPEAYNRGLRFLFQGE